MRTTILFYPVVQKFIVYSDSLSHSPGEGKIHALQIATKAPYEVCRAVKETGNGKIKTKLANQKIDAGTEALVSMIGDNQVDSAILGFKLMVTENSS